jgi:hypothetical protein
MANIKLNTAIFLDVDHSYIFAPSRDGTLVTKELERKPWTIFKVPNRIVCRYI